MIVNDMVSGYVVEYGGDCGAIYETLVEAEAFAENCTGSKVMIQYYEATITDIVEVWTYTRKDEER